MSRPGEMLSYPTPPIRTVGIIGTGLIGGSMALDIKSKHFADTILGCNRRPESSAAALRLGLIDRSVTLDGLIRESDLILLCIPADAAAAMLPGILDRIGERKPADGESLPVVLDACSVKGNIVEAVRHHPRRGRFVAGHPMSGTEYSGPQAALSGLFKDKAGIICDAEDSDEDAIALVESLYEALGMRIVRMSAGQHDVHTAYVSHLSHAISFALALTVLDKEYDDKHIFDLASGGFSSTVRLAKSNADMWVPVFSQNRDNLLPVMDAYMMRLQELRDAVAVDDQEKIRELIACANKIRRIIQ